FSSSCPAAATSAICSLSLHDALPIWGRLEIPLWSFQGCSRPRVRLHASPEGGDLGSAYCVLYEPVGGGILLHISSMPLSCEIRLDRKSTRLNSSHVKISYAVFCLKKK